MDYKLDPITHDIVIEGGDFVMVERADDTRQAIKIRLLTIKGEWFLDPTIGWLAFAELFGKPAKEATIRAACIACIAGVAGVKANSVVIERLDLNSVARTLAIRWRCTAFSGEALAGTTEVGA